MTGYGVGLIVSVLNHAMHKIQQNKSFKEQLEAKGINPDPYAIHMLSANRVDANWGCLAIKGGISEWNRFTTAVGTISGLGLYDLGTSGTMNVNVQYAKPPNVYIKN